MLLHSLWKLRNKVVMDAPELHYFKNPPTKTWIETRLISLPSSKQEKSNQNARMISLPSSNQEKSNPNAELITLPSSNQEKSNPNALREHSTMLPNYYALSPYCEASYYAS